MPDARSPSGATAAAPLGAVTLMFTDIEGSTGLLERLRDGYAVVLEDHRDLMRAAFAQWGGYEVDTQGDSFFVAFAGAGDAVRIGPGSTTCSSALTDHG